ncbi:MAG: iron ABC transporter permease [Desulfomonilia bacterium]|jgi:iron complex transport system permease protein|nr:iron ABC transporter permease [Desulfomonilia bacterium]HPW69163.1 iron ABC transporter permease [Deltaproteobacteria bacterium]
MKKWQIVLLTLFFLTSLCMALCAGRYPIGPGGIARIVLSGLGLDGVLGAPDREALLIFWNIRSPRIIMSFVVGCGISIAGAVFQALFRNPLAAPDILGVTAGSCFGAALAILFLTNVTLAVQGSAFIFGIAAVTLAYFMALSSWDRSAAVLVISGIVVSAFFQAGLSILMYVADPYDQLAQIVFWIMGSFHTSSWAKIAGTLPLIVTGSLLLGVFSWRLNIMTQNEEEALSLGINVLAWRIFYVTISTLIVAASVSTTGAIAWIGLIMPHIARFLVGTDHKKLIPATAFLGGTFMMLMDTLARTVLASEIPISIVTSIIGAPFLGYLVLSRRYAGARNELGN